MLNVFIIEDEIPAQINLKRALKVNFDDIEVVGSADSVKGAVAWLAEEKNKADIVFMDVELSDGTCFEIFKQVEVRSKIIITTAYDNYAVRAFKVNSVDYLLKPIDTEELIAAVQKCRVRAQEEKPIQPDYSMLLEHLNQASPLKEYKQRFIIKIGDRIIIVKVQDVAYFISQDKTSYLVTKEGKMYIVDQSLDGVETLLDPTKFFRISRACITHVSAISSVSKHFSGRLKIALDPKVEEDIFVSRVRTNDFMKWLNG